MLRVSLALALVTGLGSLATAQSSPARVRKDAPAVRAKLPAAPYVSPRVGTRYVYTNFTQTVTKVDGLRAYFSDPKRGPSSLIARFIPENPKVPLTVRDTLAFKSLWPLQVGRETILHTMRGEEQQQWNIVVVDTETVKVPAGKFLTYRVDGTENTVLTRNPQAAATNLTTWWYAPSIAAIVRVKFVRAKGPGQGGVARNELLRIER